MKAKSERAGKCIQWFSTIGKTLVFIWILLSLIGSLWFAPSLTFPMMNGFLIESLKPSPVLPGLLTLVFFLGLIARKRQFLSRLGQRAMIFLFDLLLSRMTSAKQYITFFLKSILGMDGLMWTLRSRNFGLVPLNPQPMPRYCFHE